MPTLETNQLLAVAVDAADSRKAEDIRILALDPSESALTDYFLICNGTNERQNAAIADEIEGRLKREFGVYPNSTEGRRQGEWILMDYVDFVVHIFMPEKREYYGLERLRKTATTLSPAELNGEIEKAIKATRKKNPKPAETEVVDAPAVKKAAKKVARKAAPAQEIEEASTKQGGKTGRKTSSKIAIAIADEAPAKKKTPAKKTAAEKKAAKKAVPKPQVIPQPAARKKPAAKKKS